jgi:oligoribonuclease NrnB/cAMP/cGMP phosphodiesterase (DHH superfamily)
LRNFCISHSKDVDGIGSAALVLAARGGGFKLTGYDEVLEDLGEVPAGVDSFVLCDIGVDQSRLAQFVDQLGALAKRCEVTYIDHHYLSAESARRLRRAGVKLVHDVEECASMLTYQTFRSELPEEAKKIALYGAVTDYMDASPLAKKMMEREDRLFILLEAGLLSNSVAERGDDMEYVRMLAEELSKMKQPHEIDRVPKLAVEQLRRTLNVARDVKRGGKKMEMLAYMKTDEHATGSIAKLLIGAFDVPVGVAFREKNEPGWYEVSFRGTSDCKVHLGRVVGRLAEKYGGGGGGHKLAAGCRIPRGKIVSLLKDLNRRL